MAKKKTVKKRENLAPVVANGVTWIDINDPSRETLAELKKRFPFLLEEDLEECLPPFQRPKLIERQEYLFMVLVFPVYDDRKGAIRPAEVDFFIGRDFIVTSHPEKHPALAALAAACGADPASCEIRYDGNPGKWTYAALHELIVDCFPVITKISREIDAVEEKLADAKREELIGDILRARTGILDIRKSMQGHRNVLKKFLERAPKFFSTQGLEEEYEDVVGHLEDIWGFLENDKDTIDAIYDSHVSLVSFETNRATKTLTALAFVIFPMTLVAGLFSMNAAHTPWSGSPGDFWMMLAVVSGTGLAIVLFLKGKRWL